MILKLEPSSKQVLNQHQHKDLVLEVHSLILLPSAKILLPKLNHLTSSLHIKR